MSTERLKKDVSLIFQQAAQRPADLDWKWAMDGAREPRVEYVRKVGFDARHIDVQRRPQRGRGDANLPPLATHLHQQQRSLFDIHDVACPFCGKTVYEDFGGDLGGKSQDGIHDGVKLTLHKF
jgi:hypothetical protein